MRETADFLIRSLKLEPNPDGGYYRETYRSTVTDRDGRATVSIIFYLLTPDNPVGRLHRHAADSVHYFHCGSALDVHTVHEGGRMSVETMGADLRAGHCLQLVVPGNVWKALELRDPPYALISEIVCPAWVPEDHESAGVGFVREHRHLHDRLRHLIRTEV